MDLSLFWQMFIRPPCLIAILIIMLYPKCLCIMELKWQGVGVRMWEVPDSIPAGTNKKYDDISFYSFNTTSHMGI